MENKFYFETEGLVIFATSPKCLVDIKPIKTMIVPYCHYSPRPTYTQVMFLQKM
jgi:hypothetical protein